MSVCVVHIFILSPCRVSESLKSSLISTFTCSSENRLLLKYFSLNCNKSLDLVSKEEKLEQTNKSLFEM